MNVFKKEESFTRKKQDKFLPLHPHHGERLARRERYRSVGVRERSWIGSIVMWCLFFLTAVYMLFFSDFVRLDTIRVSGTNKLSVGDIQNTIGRVLVGTSFKVVPQNGFFSIRPHRLEGLLGEAYPLIRTVSVRRVFPNHLDVTIEEREKIVLWCSGGPCFLLSEEGMAADGSEASRDTWVGQVLTVVDTSAQSVIIGRMIADADFSGFIVAIRPALESRLNLSVEPRFLTPSRFADEVEARTTEGWRLFLNTRVPLATSLDALALLFEKELPRDKRANLDYIDLRTENRAYYVMRKE